MIIVVSGSRSWSDKQKIREWLIAMNPTLVIEGGHRYKKNPNISADALTAQVCDEEGIPLKTMKADWKQYPGFAGHIRNAEMLDENPDLVIAFWDGTSSGTAGMIKEANRRQIWTEIVYE